MQTKSVILTIATILVAGIVLVMLLGRAPSPTVGDTATIEQTAPSEDTQDGDDNQTAAADDDVSEPSAIPHSQQDLAEAEAAAASAEEPAAANDDAPATAGSDTPAAEAAAAAAAPAVKDDTDLLSGPASTKVDVEKAMQDRVLGSPDAPVTIIEYASMTCPHCAHFSNTILPEVKKQLVETGKARIIFRDFPLDNVAARAAAMARCADHDKYFDLVEVIFKDQDRWIQNDQPMKALAQLGTLAGMDEEYIKACISDPQLNAAILKNMQDAQKKYTIKSTPTFIFNEGAEKFDGAKDIQLFVETVNRLSSGR